MFKIPLFYESRIDFHYHCLSILQARINVGTCSILSKLQLVLDTFCRLQLIKRIFITRISLVTYVHISSVYVHMWVHSSLHETAEVTRNRFTLESFSDEFLKEADFLFNRPKNFLYIIRDSSIFIRRDRVILSMTRNCRYTYMYIHTYRYKFICSFWFIKSCKVRDSFLCVFSILYIYIFFFRIFYVTLYNILFYFILYIFCVFFIIYIYIFCVFYIIYILCVFYFIYTFFVYFILFDIIFYIILCHIYFVCFLFYIYIFFVYFILLHIFYLLRSFLYKTFHTKLLSIN